MDMHPYESLPKYVYLLSKIPGEKSSLSVGFRYTLSFGENLMSFLPKPFA
jgi:hypothetical protein